MNDFHMLNVFLILLPTLFAALCFVFRKRNEKRRKRENDFRLLKKERNMLRNEELIDDVCPIPIIPP